MSRPSLLLDVDGVVADMVGGLRKWTNEEFGIDFRPDWIVYHDRMGRSPRMAEVNEQFLKWFPQSADEEYYGFGGAFRCFMKDRDVYGTWINPIRGAVDVVANLRQQYEIVFVTALMKSARDHFRSKMEWLERWFPGIPIMTSPSGEKWRVGEPGDFAVDDRYDTCMRWITRKGARAMVFRQTWNEIPDGVSIATYDWTMIEKALT